MRRLISILFILTSSTLFAQEAPPPAAKLEGGLLNVVWQKAFSPNMYGSANHADLDGDGKSEIIFITTLDKKLHAMRLDGSFLFETPIRQNAVSNPSVIDVDGDGKVEIVFGTDAGDKSNLFCVNNDGNIRWKTPLLSPVQWTTAVPITFNLAGEKAICVGSASGYLYCFDKEGHPLWVFDTSSEYSRSITELNPFGLTPAKPKEGEPDVYAIQGHLAAGDVNSDGWDEILFPTDRGVLFCLDRHGRIVWKCRLGAGTSTGPVIADLNKDGKPEVVCGGGTEDAGAVMALAGATGELLWKCPIAGEIDSPLAVADTDNDGSYEIFALNTSAHIYCIDAKGEKRWENFAAGGSWSAPLLADLDNNGRMEIIAGLKSGKLAVFTQGNGKLLQEEWLTSPSYASPTLGDFDSDGRLDVIVPLRGGVMTLLTSAKPSGKVGWASWRNDPTQTACLWKSDAKPVETAPRGSLDGVFILSEYQADPDKPYRIEILAQDGGNETECRLELLRDEKILWTGTCTLEGIGAARRGRTEITFGDIEDGPATFKVMVGGKEFQRKMAVASEAKVRDKIAKLNAALPAAREHAEKRADSFASAISAEMLSDFAEECVSEGDLALASRVADYARYRIQECEMGVSDSVGIRIDEPVRNKLVISQNSNLSIWYKNRGFCTTCPVPGDSLDFELSGLLKGKPLDRDYVFEVRLIDSFGTEIARTDIVPDTPTSRWRPEAGVYLPIATINIPRQLADSITKPIVNPPIYEGTHHLVLNVKEPGTGNELRLGKIFDSSAPFRGCKLLTTFDIYDSPMIIRKIYTDLGKTVRIIINRRRNTADKASVRLSLISPGGGVLWDASSPVPDGLTAVCVFRHPALDPSLGTEFRAELYIGQTLESRVSVPALGARVDNHVSVSKENQLVAGDDGLWTPILIYGLAEQGADVSVEVFANGLPYASFKSLKPNAEGRLHETLKVRPHFGTFDVHVTATKGDKKVISGHKLIATVVEVRDNRLYVNGEPFILKSVNVHGLHGGSRAITANTMRVLKEHGFNNLRADWPPLWQVQLAGELGLTYMPLGPFSCTDTDKIYQRYITNDPLYGVRRETQDFIEMFRDEAAVLLWNSANETGGEITEMLIDMYPLFKTLDPYQRPVVYANLGEQGEYRGMDIVGVNLYTGFRIDPRANQSVIEYLTKTNLARGKAVIFTEFNNWYGPVHRPGAECIFTMGQYGLDMGMTGTTLYKSCDVPEHHPGLFTSDESLGRINRPMSDALKTFHADVELAWTAPDAITIKNRRDFTIQKPVLAVRFPDSPRNVCEPIKLDNIPPKSERIVKIAEIGSMNCIDTRVDHETHYGLKTFREVRLLKTQ
ncbi:MAG TPA: FG-GAP-like repeat-containing protein [Candidatus Brocadiia bacterium]|nr:FG-GAP-like repeat-containing protein [Candidatus Brocadiia bacterium]